MNSNFDFAEEFQTISTVTYIKLVCYGLLLSLMYFTTLKGLVTVDWSNDAFNYGYLIPWIVLYLLWLRRDELKSVPSEPSWEGFIPLISGIILFWVGEFGSAYFLLYISFWLALVGLCWIHLGWHKLKIIAFPLCFILTMFPPPSFLYAKITLEMRLISSQIGVALISLFGLPVYREGNIIDLGYTQMQVVEACSGLHSLISILVLSLLLVYFSGLHLWKKAFLIVSSVPLVIFTNSMRIALTAILYKWWGAEAAEGFFHGFSGLLIYLFCIPILLAEMWLLNKLPPHSKSTSSTRLGSNPRKLPVDRSRHTSFKADPTHSFRYFFGAAIILLGITLAISQFIEFREKIPIRKSFDQFPVTVGNWSGTRRPMEAKFIDELNFNDYVIVDYTNGSGEAVNLYVAYYERQIKEKIIHSPAACLPKSGWSFSQDGPASIPSTADQKKPLKVYRAVLEKNGATELSYFWYAQRGRILTNAYIAKLYNFWDAITMQRTDGALVRLITPVYTEETIEDAEDRLQQFVQIIVPVLDEHIPGENSFAKAGMDLSVKKK